MRFATFFRIALFAPFLLAVLPFVFRFDALMSIFLAPMLGGGIPYLVFLVLVLAFSLRRSDDLLKMISLGLPLMFLPFSVGFWLIVGDGANWGSTLREIGGLTLVIGYGYVLVFWLVWLGISRMSRGAAHGT